MTTVHDITGNADAFRAAYPSWPRPEPLGGVVGQGEESCTAERPIVGGYLRCNYEAGHTEPGHLDGRTGRVWGLPDEGCDWANELSRKQRAELAARLARACKRSYSAARFVVARDPQPADVQMMLALTLISAEMAPLHLDITERAEVATS